MSDTKTEEKKEEATKGPTKHKVPEGHITPVEATHRLKKEINPATGKPYAEANLSSQQVYTLLNSSATNGMPVHHFDAEGNKHKTVQTKEVDGHVIKLTRPGFDWDELADWWANKKPTRGKKAETAEKSGEEGSEASGEEASQEASDEANKLDELEEDDPDGDDDEIVEAE